MLLVLNRFIPIIQRMLKKIRMVINDNDQPIILNSCKLDTQNPMQVALLLTNELHQRVNAPEDQY